MNGNVRPRAILAGLVMAALVCAATPYNNMYLGGTLLGGGHFPLAPFFILAWLTVLMAMAARLLRRPPLLSGLELLTAWALMTLASGVPYTGLVRTFFINLTAPVEFADAGNRWGEVLGPLLPQGLYLADEGALRALYDGIRGGAGMSWIEILARIDWAAWARPLAAWGSFILLSYAIMLFLVNLLSRQWIANERMNFPLLRLPQFMTEAFEEHRLAAFLGNWFLIAGVLVPVVLHTINGLAFYYPQVPSIPTTIYAAPYVPATGIFSGFLKLRFHLYPAFIGFAYLTSRQISLSMWIFYLLGGLLGGILATAGLALPPAALGVAFGPTLSSVEETQMLGAYLVFFVFIIWLARHHLWAVLRSAFVPGAGMTPETEWISVRAAFWGLIACSALLAGWCIFFGMPLMVTALVLPIFFIVTIVASRVICQGGIAYFTLTSAPLDGLLAALGSKFFGGVGLLLSAALQKALFVDLRESLMPSLVHAAKVSEGARTKRLVFAGIVAVLLVGVGVSFAAMLVLTHKYGMRELNLPWATSTVTTVYENVQRLVEAPAAPNPDVLAWAIAGAAVMAVLIVCYNRFYWWPIHPIGYLATYSSAMRILWLSFFMGWLCNQLTLRYGGVSLFRQVRFFFFGLILGDFLMGGLWAAIGAYVGSSYMVLPD